MSLPYHPLKEFAPAGRLISLVTSKFLGACERASCLAEELLCFVPSTTFAVKHLPEEYEETWIAVTMKVLGRF